MYGNRPVNKTLQNITLFLILSPLFIIAALSLYSGFSGRGVNIIFSMLYTLRTLALAAAVILVLLKGRALLALTILLAPLFAALWTWLGRRNL